MEPQSRAHGLFEQLIAGDEQAQLKELYKLATGKVPEEEYLEFKSGKSDEQATKKYWSQALSAFANGDGGVLIFGIKTDKKEIGGGRRIEISDGPELVDQPDVLVQLLKDTRLKSTVDPVPGVQLQAVKDKNGQGFVVALIPDGPNKPYRADSDPSRNYFWRIGDSFEIMSHTWLRRLFYPRLRSKFEIQMEAGWQPAQIPNQKYLEVRFFAWIKNTGNSSARDLICEVKCNQELIGLPAGTFPLPDEISVRLTYGGRIHQLRSLHPGDKIEFFNVVIRYDTFDHTKLTQFAFKFFMTDQEPLEYRAEYNDRSIMYNRQQLATPVECL